MKVLHRGHVKEKRIELVEDTILKDNCSTRMLLQGYTKAEIKLFKKACQNRNEEMFNQVPCKCSNMPEKSQCEKCYLLELEAKLNPKRRNLNDLQRKRYFSSIKG
jgi:hypothetical protein